MKTKNTLSLLRPIPSTALTFFLSIFLTATGCTLSKTPKETNESLVNSEAPIFDKRFKEISFQELNLKNFWFEETAAEKSKQIVIHNNTFADLTEKVKDGVVNIYTLRLEEREAKFGIAPNDLLPIKIPVISTLFEIVPFQVPIPFKTEGLSLGSGFIINEQGYILTNAHVIQNALDIRVLLSEERKEYPAKIIGMDRLTDTALIKIEPDHLLTILPLGNSDSLRTGELVLAIGNPLGLRHSVTSGIISAKERVSPRMNDQYANFLQTDSAINPGSSGGPLLNLYGEVVGINTAIVTEAQLIGFAVPVNTVKEVMPMLVLGQTDRGWLGIKAVPLSLQDAVELNYDEAGALLVKEVEKGSPAEKSGIKPKDIIVKMDGQPLKNFIIFRRKMLGLAPGNKVRLTIIRDGIPSEISSVLVKRNPDDPF